jgi:guanylate kinase
MNPTSTQPATTQDGPPLLVVISAPSGGGKTTLCQQLLASRRGMKRAITCTTRAPRPGEVDGVDYYFLSPEKFVLLVGQGAFLEHAQVHGNRYGTLRAEVLEKVRRGEDVLLNIDVQGAASVRDQARLDPELAKALVTVFLTPPSLAVLEHRLKKRGTDAPEVIERRLGAAKKELSHWRDFDYLLLSGSVEEDLRRAMAIIEAEKMKAGRAMAPDL